VVATRPAFETGTDLVPIPLQDFCERYMPELKIEPAADAHIKQITKAQNKQMKSIASPQMTGSQTSLEDGEIRPTQ